jgi:hypothetical protein
MATPTASMLAAISGWLIVDQVRHVLGLVAQRAQPRTAG